MLFVAPASATSGLAIVSGLGSFLVALESIVARGRMMALNKEVADLVMLPAPCQKQPQISPIFISDKVTLHASWEKDGKLRLVYAG